MDDQINTLKSIRGGLNDQYSYRLLSGATLSVAKVGRGVLHSIHVGNLSMPTLTIYDQASGASGTIIAMTDINYPRGTYVLDVAFTNGLSASFQPQASTAAEPLVTLSYK
jgi:hypothetical protein